MADASALGADGSNPMEVQVLSPAPRITPVGYLAVAAVGAGVAADEPGRV